MRWLVRSFAVGGIVSVSMTAGAPTLARAGEEAAKAPKEGAGDAGISKEQIAYGKMSSRANSLRSRIKEANKKFAEIVKAKNASRDAQEKQRMAEELAAISKQRGEWQKELATLEQDLNYKYPNKGKPIDKNFGNQERRGPDPNAVYDQLADKLVATKRKVEAKYKPLMPPEEAEGTHAAPKAGTPTVTAPEKPKRLRLEK